jgi:hypothetical protein
MATFLPTLLAHGDEEIEQASSFLPTIGKRPAFFEGFTVQQLQK